MANTVSKSNAEKNLVMRIEYTIGISRSRNRALLLLLAMEMQVNQLKRDEFGRVHGIVAVDKPAGMTSHDVVYEARKALGTKKVGHAGALDPFATGVLLVLVGKATKYSDQFIATDKEYVMEILFGISTNSADTEGKITQQYEDDIDLSNLEQVLQKFVPEYEQYVPVFSSVKVDGNKLRVLARKFDDFELLDKEDGKYVRFFSAEREHVLKLPKHLCKIPEIELLSIANKDVSEIDSLGITGTFKTAKVRVACSKGTYIRTLAEDIGKSMNPPVPAMLTGLQRTRVGDVNISDCVQISELGSL